MNNKYLIEVKASLRVNREENKITGEECSLPINTKNWHFNYKNGEIMKELILCLA